MFDLFVRREDTVLEVVVLFQSLRRHVSLIFPFIVIVFEDPLIVYETQPLGRHFWHYL